MSGAGWSLSFTVLHIHTHTQSVSRETLLVRAWEEADVQIQQGLSPLLPPKDNHAHVPLGWVCPKPPS